MDPNAALKSADQAISDLDLATAADRLFEYYQWRVAGGFAPTHDDLRWYTSRDTHGDSIAAKLVTRYQDARDRA